MSGLTNIINSTSTDVVVLATDSDPYTCPANKTTQFNELPELVNVGTSTSFDLAITFLTAFSQSSASDGNTSMTGSGTTVNFKLPDFNNNGNFLVGTILASGNNTCSCSNNIFSPSCGCSGFLSVTVTITYFGKSPPPPGGGGPSRSPQRSPGGNSNKPKQSSSNKTVLIGIIIVVVVIAIFLFFYFMSKRNASENYS